MELTAREKIIVKAASNKIEGIIRECGDDFESLDKKITQAQKNLAVVFGDNTDIVFDAILEGIEERAAMEDIANSGLLDKTIIQSALSDAMKDQLEKRKDD